MAEIEREVSTAPHQETNNSLFLDAYNFCKDTANHPEARLCQAEVATIATVNGGIQEGCKEIVNHPLEVAGKVAVAGTVGAALGAAVVAESPVIAGGAIGVGIIGTGASLWHTYSSLASNKDFQHSMDAVFRSPDQRTVNKSIRTVSDALGPEVFNYTIGLAGGLGNLFRPKLANSLSIIPFATKLSQYFRPTRSAPWTIESYDQFIPMPKSVGGNTVEMYFKHDVTLHAHVSANSALLRADGIEYVVNTNKHGIDLASFISKSGKQIIKGQSQEKLPLEVSINPETGVTKVNGYGKTWEYQFSEKNRIENPYAYEWLSCRNCNPFKKPEEPWFK